MENIDSEIKGQLNKEGFEGNAEGGAAVIAGTEEEIEKQRKIIETEGRTPDLASFILLHKRIAVPYNKIDERGKNGLPKAGVGYVVYDDSNTHRFQLIYMDRERNIAQVDVDMEKISLLADMKRGQAVDELSELGFKIIEDSRAYHIKGIVERYKAELEQQLEHRKREEFIF